MEFFFFLLYNEVIVIPKPNFRSILFWKDLKMYTIGQVSEMFSIPVSTLRYYDRDASLSTVILASIAIL